MRRAAVLVGLLAMGPGAEAAPADVVAGLGGSWAGEGTVMKRVSRSTMRLEPVLAGRYLRLTWRSDIATPGGAVQTFEGHAYYKAAGEGRYRATWFDSSGNLHPVEAAAEGDSLVALWGTPETEQGRTVYRLLGPAQLEVVDSFRGKDGAWTEFGRATLRRE